MAEEDAGGEVRAPASAHRESRGRPRVPSAVKPVSFGAKLSPSVRAVDEKSARASLATARERGGGDEAGQRLEADDGAERAAPWVRETPAARTLALPPPGRAARESCEEVSVAGGGG